MAIAIVDIGIISRTSSLHGDVPYISSKGVTVRHIDFWYKRGLAAEDIGDDCIGHITLAKVYAALSYYHANVAEIKKVLDTRLAIAVAIEVQQRFGKHPLIQPFIFLKLHFAEVDRAYFPFGWQEHPIDFKPWLFHQHRIKPIGADIGR